MAKTKSINKSAAIRAYAKAHPSDGPTAVVAALKNKGISVTPQAVSTVKSKAGLSKKRKTKKRASAGRVGRPAGSQNGGRAVAASANGKVSVDSLIAAKKFVAAAGSAEQAIELIKGLQKLDAA